MNFNKFTRILGYVLLLLSVLLLIKYVPSLVRWVNLYGFAFDFGEPLFSGLIASVLFVPLGLIYVFIPEYKLEGLRFSVKTLIVTAVINLIFFGILFILSLAKIDGLLIALIYVLIVAPFSVIFIAILLIIALVKLFRKQN